MPNAIAPLLVAAFALFATALANGQSYTSTYGYTKVNVPTGTLAAVSASLKLPAEFTGDAVVNADYNAVAGTQTITVANVNWGAGQWTGQAYIVYICDSNGAEETFLILSHIGDTLTISTTFDLQSASRAIPDSPATTSISIHPARTMGNTFGTGAGTDFTPADLVYIWAGSGWATYFYFNGWRKAGEGGTKDDDIVYPDEGLFIYRGDPADLELTFLGTVPSKPQVTTIPAPGTQMISTRYPVSTTFGDLALQDLPNWQPGADLAYLWNGSGWDTYFYFNGWRKAGQGGTVDDDPIPPNSALFISRSGTATAAESGKAHPLPYAPSP